MNIGLMTSTSKRHAYFVHEIMKKVDLKIVILEEKPSFTNTRMKYSEEYFFGEYTHIKTAKRIKVGEINSESMIDFIISKNLDICFIFGTSLLSKKLLNKTSCKFINIHTGLTQFYRGVDSSLWAIYNNELEKIGATIHVVDKGIDTGHILLQTKTPITHSDNHGDIFMKTCKAGIDILCQNLQKILNEGIEGKKLNERGRLYTSIQMNSKIYEFLDKNSTNLIKKFKEKNNE